MGTWRGGLGSVLAAAWLPVTLLPLASSSQEGSGSLSSPTESPQADVDTQHGASSMPGTEEPGAQPVPSTSRGAPGTQPGSEETQAGTHRAPVSPEKAAGAPSDGKSISDASATTPSMQPGSPGAQSTTQGMEPGYPGTQITTPGTQPAFPGIKTTSPGEKTRSPGTGTATPGVQPGSPGMSHLQEPAMPWGSSAFSSTSGHGMEMVEALGQSGQLGHPKKQVAHLEATKSDHAVREQTHLLFPEGGRNPEGAGGGCLAWEHPGLGAHRAQSLAPRARPPH